jgi:TetR/AcrR family transcriptional regulator, transcriptional repressor of bet genes
MPGTKAPERERRDQILQAAYRVAAREGLDGTTILQVAAEAGLSPGLVMFHFKSKRQLLLALLDWLLATTTVLHVGDDIARLTAPLERLIALLRQEMQRLSREPLRIRLTFDYWTAGIRDAEIRNRLRAEFDRYREAFRPLATAVLHTEPERFPGVTPDGLAAVAVSFIKGCAVQSMIDPVHFDIAQYLAAAEGLMAQFETPPARRRRPRLA